MTTAILRGTLLKLKGRSPDRRRVLDADVFGQKFGVVASLLGCWHENLSRPFGLGKMTYRSCLGCGARTPFDPETLVTHGKFYRPPTILVQ